MRFWLGCQVWFNSRRPFRDGPAMSTRDEMKPPVIKVMHILFTVVLLSRNSPLFLLCLPTHSENCVRLCVCVAGLCRHWGVTGKLCPADKWHVGHSKRQRVATYSKAKSSAPTPFHQTAYVSPGSGSFFCQYLYLYVMSLCFFGCYVPALYVCLGVMCLALQWCLCIWWWYVSSVRSCLNLMSGLKVFCYSDSRETEYFALQHLWWTYYHCLVAVRWYAHQII